MPFDKEAMLKAFDEAADKLIKETFKNRPRLKVELFNEQILEDSYFKDVKSIFCDSGFSINEAILCNIHLEALGNIIWGVKKIELDNLNNITIQKGEFNTIKHIAMQFHKHFDKSTECKVSGFKEDNIIIKCTTL